MVDEHLSDLMAFCVGMEMLGPDMRVLGKSDGLPRLPDVTYHLWIRPNTLGERVKDVVEVCSQAIRSAKWKWRFSELRKHIQGREDRLTSLQRPTRYLAGNGLMLNELIKMARFKPIEAEIVIVQPGLSVRDRTADQNLVLAAAVSYLKETIGCDMDIVCSE